MSWDNDYDDAAGQNLPRTARLPGLDVLTALDMECYPPTAPGMPVPGPDFSDQAVALGDPKPRVVGKGADKRVVACGPNLEELYRGALYLPDFLLAVKVKNRYTTVACIPGHRWAGSAYGPVPCRVMVVLKWPAFQEAAARRNLAGESGAILATELEALGVGPEEWGQWYVTNLVKHPNPDPSADKPAKSLIHNCLPLLANELRLVRPDYVLALGAEAYLALVGPGAGPVSQAQGRVFERSCRLDRTDDGPAVHHRYQVMACIHPAAVAHSLSALPAFRNGLARFVDLFRGRLAAQPKEELDHHLVHSPAQLGYMVDEILAEDPRPALALDCEWHGDYPSEPGTYLRTLQFSHKPGSARCVVFRDVGGTLAFQGDPREAVPHLRRLFVDSGARLITHHGRADLPWVKLALDESFGAALIRAYAAPPNVLDASGRILEWGWKRSRTEGGFDTLNAAHAVRETDGSYALDLLGLEYCGIAYYAQELQQWRADFCKEHKIEPKDLGGYGMCPGEVLYSYALWDADVTQRLFRRLNVLLDSDAYGNNCRAPFWVTMRAAPAFLEMEMTGLLIDRQRGDRQTALYWNQREQLKAQVQELFRWPGFNPQSAQQCMVALFGPEYSSKRNQDGNRVELRPDDQALSLGLLPVKTTSKPSQDWARVVDRKQQHLYSPSTDKEALGGLITRLAGSIKQGGAPEYGYEHVNALRNYRFIGQVVKSVLRPPAVRGDHDNVSKGDDVAEPEYEDGLLSCIHVDGRVRTHLFQTKETGRASSARPPLQNISKRREKAYKDILGASYLYPLRSMIQATPGYMLVEADYRGAELFMMAIQSGSAKMIDHCLRANLPDGDPQQYDIHSAIAVKAFDLDCPPTKKGLTGAGLPHIRDVTKTIVFGIPYGRGDAAVVRAVEEEGTQISRADAAMIRAAVLQEYKELEKYFEGCQKRSHDPGWMRNCFGRYRRCQRLRSGGDDGGAAEREFGNFPIQSGVADAVSRALDHFHDWPERYDNAGPKFRIVLQIHDAILFEVRLDCLAWFLGAADQRGVVDVCMTDRVAIKACDLNGYPRPGTEPFHMSTETALYLHWGEKFSRDEGLAWGVPELFLPAAKS